MLSEGYFYSVLLLLLVGWILISCHTIVNIKRQQQLTQDCLVLCIHTMSQYINCYLKTMVKIISIDCKLWALQFPICPL